MTARVAIVTGGLRGLGRAMALGLAGVGHRVVAVGHIAEDIERLAAEIAGTPLGKQVIPMLADLRRPADCDHAVEAAETRFGALDVLINNAGLTLTYIDPERGRRSAPPKFWEASDAVVQAVMDTNYVAADQMARRAAPRMVDRGWGRIINVTTMLTTMNRAGFCPYGASKAALEMATEVWSKELAGTGVTVNCLNPGGGANTDGIAPEIRDASRAGRIARLVEPEAMVPPLLWLVSSAADAANGYRFDANRWDAGLPPEHAARRSGGRAGLVLHAEDEAG
jgi:NAD(P)-dependent dehydrogenase (short-subunit alcohol dehydrogenase family)